MFGQDMWMYTKFIKVESFGLLEEVKGIWGDVETVLFWEYWRLEGYLFAMNSLSSTIVWGFLPCDLLKIS